MGNQGGVGDGRKGTRDEGLGCQVVKDEGLGVSYGSMCLGVSTTPMRSFSDRDLVDASMQLWFDQLHGILSSRQ